MENMGREQREGSVSDWAEQRYVKGVPVDKLWISCGKPGDKSRVMHKHENTVRVGKLSFAQVFNKLSTREQEIAEFIRYKSIWGRDRGVKSAQRLFQNEASEHIAFYQTLVVPKSNIVDRTGVPLAPAATCAGPDVAALVLPRSGSADAAGPEPCAVPGDSLLGGAGPG